MKTYQDFFHQVTGHQALRYQIRLHETIAPIKAVEVPTGLGKTQAVLADWLYRRPTTRLAWVLPGRALTEQVRDVAAHTVKQSDADVQVIELMGGSEDNDLTLRPDQPAILVGTQDLLISRALNRGYARSPFRWPIDFALLNNDTQWIFDEVQLLGDALGTSTQLAAFREQFKTFGECPCIWLSATFDPDWLKTVDFTNYRIEHLRLTADDEADAVVKQRLDAVKPIAPAPQQCRTPKGCAEFALKQHREGTLSLIITNTVERAREIYQALPKDIQPVLLHSRFRPVDRAAHLGRVLSQRQGIVVSTQVLEAGVDLDSDLLITDSAPWPSLVQRFGRVNRYGTKKSAQIYWVDTPQNAKGKEIAGPYEEDSVAGGREILASLTSASPRDLPRITAEPPYAFVLRRADLLDLFDTTPDLAGNQIDVSRFVRSGRETDIFVAWRDPGVKRPLHDEELCPVPLGKEIKTLIEKYGAQMWKHTRNGGWEEVDADKLYPGMRIVLNSKAGGYDKDTGWLYGSKQPVEPAKIAGNAADLIEDAHDTDPLSERQKQTLAEHTDEVVAVLQQFLSQLPKVGLENYRNDLLKAARLHDWGKAHPVFQQTMYNKVDDWTAAPDELLAKQVKKDARPKHSRPYFRHELASAIAMLQAGESDLAAYIAAAHHGKVRMNIRSMPGEIDLSNLTKRIARGVQEGDALFKAIVGGGEVLEPTELKLSVAGLGIADGQASWADRVSRLLDALGPFRLAFLEMLLRCADGIASSGRGKEESHEQLAQA